MTLSLPNWTVRHLFYTYYNLIKETAYGELRYRAIVTLMRGISCFRVRYTNCIMLSMY
jgi:hypothetical protein